MVVMDGTLVAIGGKVVLYFPVFAVWLVLIGAVVNRDRAVIVAPLVLGALVGVLAVATTNLWLLLPVLAAWVWGLAGMIMTRRRQM
ncbi:hypothetical protein JOF56_005397 [Kibdelosporangium banguiense]|uniref:Uncharacterized protein n=1 Tax=Kibdelosporangium banguiense TaxID=1365924 RepID=A0ABS4TKR9_9PSEU|nr:hypothetical protein [Kibdelosporangium banguiense]MBP2325012.1 hypothetical protein [Kibdelosporangium banguiense]